MHSRIAVHVGTLSAAELATIRHAASAVGKPLGRYLVDSALLVAAEILAERRLFQLCASRYDAFVAALDAEPTTKPRLSRLLRDLN